MDKKYLQKTCVKNICRKQEYGADAGLAVETAKGNNVTTIKKQQKEKQEEL